jgi:hypothetical protein
MNNISREELVGVHGHRADLGRVEGLELLEGSGVLGQDEVDGRALPAEPAGPADTVDVGLLAQGQVVVDCQVDLLHVDASGQQVGGHQHPGRAGLELPHDGVPLLLLHVTVHGTDRELLFLEFFGDLVDPLLGVAVDDALADVDIAVEFDEGVELPFVLTDPDVELFDAVEGQLLVGQQDLGGVPEEGLGQFVDVGGQGGREEGDLHVRRQVLQDLGDGLLEAPGEHLVGLVKDERLEVTSLEDLLLDHVQNPAGAADNDLDAALPELPLLSLDVGTPRAAVAGDAHELTQAHDDLLNLFGQLPGGRQNEGLALGGLAVDQRQHPDREGGSLARPGLRLGDRVPALHDGQDPFLLDDRRLFEPVPVNPPQ